MATTKKGLQQVKPTPTNRELARDIRDAVRELTLTTNKLIAAEAKIDALIVRVEIVAREQAKHEVDVIAHKAGRAR